MPISSPGGDVQLQAVLQTFLNIEVFGMNPQAAVEAPRFASYAFPATLEPHLAFPGLLNLERRLGRATSAALAGLWHEIRWWPEWEMLAGAVCTVVVDQSHGGLSGGADPRRECLALGQ